MDVAMPSEVGRLMYEKQVMVAGGNYNGADNLDKIIQRKINDNRCSGSFYNLTEESDQLYKPELEGYNGKPIEDQEGREHI